jgi:hypothetical protein
MTAADCPTLERSARERYEALLGEYRQRDKDYDLKTRHGESQGATF